MTGPCRVERPARRPTRWRRASWEPRRRLDLGPRRPAPLRSGRGGATGDAPLAAHAWPRSAPSHSTQSFTPAGLQRSLAAQQAGGQDPAARPTGRGRGGQHLRRRGAVAGGDQPGCRRIRSGRAADLHAALVAVLERPSPTAARALRDYRTVDGDTGAHQRHLDCYGRGRASRATAAARRCVDACSTGGAPRGARRARHAERGCAPPPRPAAAVGSPP